MFILGSFFINFFMLLFVLVALFMIMVILVQKPKGGGLAGAFGGAGGADALIGHKIGDLLTWITVGCFVAFMLLAISITKMTKTEQAKLDQSLIPAAQVEQTDGDGTAQQAEPAPETDVTDDMNEPAAPAADNDPQTPAPENETE